MTFEAESIKFLENHIDHSFNSVMRTHTIENLEWLEGEGFDSEGGNPLEYRAFAHMQDDDSKDDSLIVLFPPFIPTGANN